MKKIWILTEEYNDYDQHGEYFVAAFSSKPNINALATFFKLDETANGFRNGMEALEFLLHIEAGGGRQNLEDHWYNLQEVELDKRYGS